jgi:hypothetical protein
MDLATRLAPAVATILRRVEEVSEAEVDATRQQLRDIIVRWTQASHDNPNVVFRDYFHPDRALLVDAARDDVDLRFKFPTLQSLRDVDMSSNLYLVR